MLATGGSLVAEVIALILIVIDVAGNNTHGR